MEAIAVSLILLIVAAQGAIWYKLGRIESAVNGHLRDHTLQTH